MDREFIKICVIGLVVIVLLFGLIVWAFEHDERVAEEECENVCTKIDAELLRSRFEFFGKNACSCEKNGEVIVIS